MTIASINLGETQKVSSEPTKLPYQNFPLAFINISTKYWPLKFAPCGCMYNDKAFYCRILVQLDKMTTFCIVVKSISLILPEMCWKANNKANLAIWNAKYFISYKKSLQSFNQVIFSRNQMIVTWMLNIGKLRVKTVLWKKKAPKKLVGTQKAQIIAQ